LTGIISNATPLIYLAKAGMLHLLKEVYGEVAIPEEVKIEVVDRGKRLGERDAYIVERAISEGWLRVLNAEAVKLPIELDPGEAAVLSLAKRTGVVEVLVDDAPARVAAGMLDLKPRGTVFVLLQALEMRKLDLDGFLESLNRLIGCGFRLREEVYVEAVREARRIAGDNRNGRVRKS